MYTTSQQGDFGGSILQLCEPNIKFNFLLRHFLPDKINIVYALRLQRQFSGLFFGIHLAHPVCLHSVLPSLHFPNSHIYIFKCYISRFIKSTEYLPKKKNHKWGFGAQWKICVKVHRFEHKRNCFFSWNYPIPRIL